METGQISARQRGHVIASNSGRLMVSLPGRHTELPQVRAGTRHLCDTVSNRPRPSCDTLTTLQRYTACKRGMASWQCLCAPGQCGCQHAGRPASPFASIRALSWSCCSRVVMSVRDSRPAKHQCLPPQRSRLPLCYTLTSILGGYAKVNYQSHHRFQTARVAYTISEAVIAWP